MLFVRPPSRFAASAFTLALLAGSPARAAGGLPSLPSPVGSDSSPRATATEDPSGGAAPAASPLERVKRGVVLVERDGRLVGFGTVLGGDGRILTALSAVGAGDAVDVRYADGARVSTKVVHRDPAWDLALLLPHTIHWKDGLSASDQDPAGADLRAPVPTRAGATPIPLPVHFKGRTDAISRQGESLVDALDVEVRHSLPIAGAPILDPQATVVGVLVRACKLAVAAGAQDSAKGGPIQCAPTLIGAPMRAVRSFRASVPPEAAPPSPPIPWLGIAGEPDLSGSVHGVRVMAVAPKSPAQKAGLRGAAGGASGDTIVAVDGQPVDSPQKLSDAIAKCTIGEPVKLLVLGGEGSFRDVPVVLRAAP
jgi:serine protease Do